MVSDYSLLFVLLLSSSFSALSASVFPCLHVIPSQYGSFSPRGHRPFKIEGWRKGSATRKSRFLSSFFLSA